jgi:outer membrane protein assembly factor BamB/DNA-directed RNA polymerase subunit RPC12/RpoP
MGGVALKRRPDRFAKKARFGEQKTCQVFGRMRAGAKCAKHGSQQHPSPIFMSSTPPTLSSSECPNCGATIDLSKITGDQTQIECEYCGSMLNLPRRERLREMQAQTLVIKVSEPKVATATYRPPAQKKSGAGCSLGVVLILFGIIGVVLWQEGIFNGLGVTTSNTSNPNLPSLPQIVVGARIYGDPLPLSRVDDGPQEIAYLTLEDSAARVVMLDATRRVERWRSRTFSDSFTNITMVADDTRMYVADQDQLVALNRADGSVAWELSLPYGVSTDYQCQFNACLRVFGDRVVARLKDGTLQAMDAATGKPAWTKQLNYTSGGMFDALGSPAIVDTLDGKNTEATFYVFDTSAGEVKQQIAPECAQTSGGASLRADYPFASDTWQTTADGKSLIVIKDGSAPCAWKYDLATGSETWRYTGNRNADAGEKLPFMSQDVILMSDDGIYINAMGSDAILHRLDMQTGAHSVLFKETRYNVTPLRANAGMVYVIAVPTFDNTKRELWAMDAISGEKRWQSRLKAAHSFDKLILEPASAGLFLMQTQYEEKAVLFDVIDPQTGASKGQQRVDMNNAVLSGQFLDGDTAWLNFSTRLHEVDMTTGTVKSTWP